MPHIRGKPCSQFLTPFGARNMIASHICIFGLCGYTLIGAVHGIAVAGAAVLFAALFALWRRS